MRLFFLMTLACAVTSFAFAEGGSAVQTVSLEAEERLTEEALARYSAPGDPTRYISLIEQLKSPGETLGPPATKLRFPAKSWPNGRPRTMVFADEAWVALSMTSLRGRMVRVETYRLDGSIESVLEADEVIVDRNAMLAVAKGRVTGILGEDKLSGRGALIDLDAQYVRILYKACIITRRTGDVDFTSRGMF